MSFEIKTGQYHCKKEKESSILPCMKFIETYLQNNSFYERGFCLYTQHIDYYKIGLIFSK